MPNDNMSTTKPTSSAGSEFTPQPIKKIAIPERIPMIDHFHQVRVEGRFT